MEKLSSATLLLVGFVKFIVIALIAMHYNRRAGKKDLLQQFVEQSSELVQEVHQFYREVKGKAAQRKWLMNGLIAIWAIPLSVGLAGQLEKAPAFIKTLSPFSLLIGGIALFAYRQLKPKASWRSDKLAANDLRRALLNCKHGKITSEQLKDTYLRIVEERDERFKTFSGEDVPLELPSLGGK